MQVEVFHYAGCGTCKQALGWLRAHSAVFEAFDIVAQTPDVATLASILATSGQPIRRLWNVTGLVYRGEGWAERAPHMDEAQTLLALSHNGRLIKRPLLRVTHDDGRVVSRIGFREPEWLDALALPGAKPARTQT